MRLRRIAGADHDIDDRNNGHRHEHGVRQQHRARTACCTRPTCCPTPTAASSTRAPVPELLELAAGRSLRALQRGKVTPTKALLHHAQGRQGGQADLRRRRRQGRALRAQPLHRRRGRATTPEPRGQEPERMKVAYWPGCVSRGFTPELHGSMAQVAPLLDIELVELDRASLLRRRRDRRAQPGARRHAQRAHVRARPAGDRRRRRADDEHLLDLPGRAERVPGAPRREHRVPRARQRDARGRGPDATRRASPNKNFLWLLVEEIGLDALKAKVKRPLTDLRVGPVLRLLHRAPDRPPRHRRRAPARHATCSMLIEALGGTVVDYAGAYKCCGFPIITMNKEASLKQAGRHLGDAIDAEADCLVTPCPLCHLNLDLQQPLARAGRRAASSACRCCTCRSSSASPRARAQGARHEQARRQADVGDRLVDLRGRASAPRRGQPGCKSARASGRGPRARRTPFEARADRRTAATLVSRSL